MAAERLDRVEVADLEAVELAAVFPDETFDAVVFADVLEHLRDPLTTLRAARHILRPGGAVYVSLPNIAHGDIRLALLKGRFKYTKTGILDNTHTRFFTRDNLSEFAKDAGFVVAELRGTHADLFSTEQRLQASDYDAAVVDLVREDPLSSIYQFVAVLVPADATSLATSQALRMQDLELQNSRLVAQAEEHGTAAHEFRKFSEQLTAELAEARASAADQAARAAQLEAEIARMSEAASEPPRTLREKLRERLR
ncbi:hypothetical protein GCM10027298_35080 [Epidermidibacterium keratini]